ncbi:MAG: hypothetical protein WDW36_004791 [Sanguina aurantia]
MLIDDRCVEDLLGLMSAMGPMLLDLTVFGTVPSSGSMNSGTSSSSSSSSGTSSSSSSSSSQGSQHKHTSSSSSSGRPGPNAHSQAAAALRAARVLHARRSARAQAVQHQSSPSLQQGSAPFPTDAVSIISGTMQLLLPICRLLDISCTEFGADRDKGETRFIAETLHAGGTLLSFLDTALTFMLCCVRHNPDTLQQNTPSSSGAASPSNSQDFVGESKEATQRGACHHLSMVCTRLFRSMLALPERRQLSLVSSLPQRFYERLCCIACEGLPRDDAALWEVSLLITSPSDLDVASNCTTLGDAVSTISLKHVRDSPAMAHVSRRVLPYAIAQRPTTPGQHHLHHALDRMLLQHPELAEHDDLLSPNLLRCCSYTSGISDTSYRVAYSAFPGERLGRSEVTSSSTSSTSSSSSIDGSSSGSTPTGLDRNYVPWVHDDSLEELVLLLAAWSKGSASGKTPALTLNDGVPIARMMAVLLSLQQPKLIPWDVRSEANKAALRATVMGAARVAATLSQQLLQCYKAGHASCACYLADEAQRREVARGRVPCLPCSALAEAMLAILLQVIRLDPPLPVSTQLVSNGGTAVPRPRPETVLAVWVQQPGALLAIEMGLRHMDSSETETSAFRAAVLCAPCLSSRIMPQVWDSGPHSSEAFLRGLSQMVSMHSLLRKLLGSDPDGENVSPAATSVRHLMHRMATHASAVSIAMDGTPRAAQTWGSCAESSESSCGDSSSSSSGSSDDGSSSAQQPLVYYRGGSLNDYVRLQLSAVRGWVLALKQTGAPGLAAAAAELYELGPGAGADATIPSRMRVTLDACGLDQWRDGGAESCAGVGALPLGVSRSQRVGGGGAEDAALWRLQAGALLQRGVPEGCVGGGGAPGDLNLGQVLAEINREMKFCKFQIKTMKSPAVDEASKLATKFSQAERDFFRSVMEAIATREPPAGSTVAAVSAIELLNLDVQAAQAPAAPGEPSQPSQSQATQRAKRLTAQERSLALRRLLQQGWLALATDRSGSYCMGVSARVQGSGGRRLFWVSNQPGSYCRGVRTMMELGDTLMDIDSVPDAVKAAWQQGQQQQQQQAGTADSTTVPGDRGSGKPYAPLPPPAGESLAGQVVASSSRGHVLMQAHMTLRNRNHVRV